MEDSDESGLDSVIRGGLKGIEGLPGDARFADEGITRYLREKAATILANERRRRSAVGEAASVEWAKGVLDKKVSNANSLYELLDRYLNRQLGSLWKELDQGQDKPGSDGDGQIASAPSKPTVFVYQSSTHRSTTKERLYLCTEGCEIQGEVAYMAHRDKGHHPVPA